jgi:hypothetical protein
MMKVNAISIRFISFSCGAGKTAGSRVIKLSTPEFPLKIQEKTHRGLFQNIGFWNSRLKKFAVLQALAENRRQIPLQASAKTTGVGTGSASL